MEIKFDLLLQIMSEHNFIYELSEKLPINIAYRYLIEEFLHDFENVLPDGWRCHVNGCGGDCPSCFQLDYCDLKDDIWPKEELDAERLKRQREDDESGLKDINDSVDLVHFFLNLHAERSRSMTEKQCVTAFDFAQAEDFY